MTQDELGKAMAEQRDAGIQHVVAVPSQSTLDEWLTSVEQIAAAASLQ
jgi:hypothetical protein